MSLCESGWVVGGVGRCILTIMILWALILKPTLTRGGFMSSRFLPSKWHYCLWADVSGKQPVFKRGTKHVMFKRFRPPKHHRIECCTETPYFTLSTILNAVILSPVTKHYLILFNFLKICLSCAEISAGGSSGAHSLFRTFYLIKIATLADMHN